METPPHSRLASVVLAFGGFALTWAAFGLIFIGTNSLRYGSKWHPYYEAADGWLSATAGASLGNVAAWACAIHAAAIAVLFYRALRRSRKAAAFWGCVVGALCLVASAIHAVWLWQQFAKWPTDLEFDTRAIAYALPPLIGAAMIFAIGAGAMLSALHFREDREVEEDRAIRKAHGISARAGFLASLSREASGFRPAIQLLLGVPAFFIFFAFCLYEFLASPFLHHWMLSSQEGSFSVALRENPDVQTDAEDTLTLHFGDTGPRGIDSVVSMIREDSAVKVRELAANLVSRRGRRARMVFVPEPETRYHFLIEMLDAASAGGVEHLEVSTAPALPAR